MTDLSNYDVNILDYDDLIEFQEAFVSCLNNGYTLGGTNAYFDNKGKQRFYAAFYYKVPSDSTTESSDTTWADSFR